jgi:hypothetical protein
MKLSQKQIAALWVSLGGSPAKANLASAVAMAESGGDTQVGNYCCHGLWALNVEVGVASMQCALDPICSTRKAISLSKNGKDWSPWEAYTNGHYSQFVSAESRMTKKQAETVLASAPFHLPLPGPLDPGKIWEEGEQLFKGEPLGINLGDMLRFFKGFGELVLTPEGWLRLAKIGGGAIFVLWGLRIVVRESTGSDPIKTVKHTATTVAAAAATKTP